MYKKSDEPIAKVNKHIYYVGAYVDGEIAGNIDAMRKYQKVSLAVIVREALRFYFEHKDSQN